MRKIIIFVTLVSLTSIANAQFGDLMKGLEKMMKDIEGNTEQQKEQPQQQQLQPQQPPQTSTPQQELKVQQNSPTINTQDQKRQEFIDSMFGFAGALYLQKLYYSISLPQMNFNVKYGAPPVSANYKKLINTDTPNRIKQFSDCSIRGGGPKIDDNSVKLWIETSNDKTAKSLKNSMDFMSLTTGGTFNPPPTRVPQTRKDLNLAPDNENAARNLLSLYDLDTKIGKNWCSEMIKSYMK